MAKTPITIARTIINAMNSTYGTHLVINVTSFFGEGGKLVRMYSVKDSYHSKGERINRELFCSASGVYTCLFMRDLLYSFQGKELSTDNEGYQNVLARKNGLANIDYMKEVYLVESGNSSEKDS